MGKSLLVFDFDGVLAIPWTNPERHYDQIPDAIKKIFESGDYVLAVASYNPLAHAAIVRWGLENYFSCIRCGANHSWHTDGTHYSEDYRVGMSKHRQIGSMIENEINELAVGLDGVFFFDDDPDNIRLVNEHLPVVKTTLVSPDSGFTLDLLPI